MDKDKSYYYVKEFYSLEQLSEELGFKITGLRKFIKNGELVASQLGNRYVVKRDSVIKWLDNNEIKKN